MRFSAAIKYNTIHVGRVDVQMSVCLKVHKILPTSTPLQSSIPNHDIKQFAASHNAFLWREYMDAKAFQTNHIYSNDGSSAGQVLSMELQNI